MAEESASKKTTLDDVIWTLLLFMLIMQLINVVPERIRNKTGFNIFHPIKSLHDQQILGPETPIGTGVRTLKDTDIFSDLESGMLIGFQGAGTLGKLADGPKTSGGIRWWNVDFEEGTDGWVAESALESTGTWLTSFISIYSVIAFAISFFLLTLVLYFTFQVNKIRGGEARKLKAQIPKTQEVRHNERWERVLTHVSSGNPNDWRLAVIEADVMLDEVVTRMGYRGASLGDKLKQIDPSDFTTIEAAWEAHKIRNKIAHSGSDYILTEREAKRIIELYGMVFREFHYI